MSLLDIRFWAGTPDSLRSYVESVTRAMEAGVMEKRADYMGQSAPATAPRLFSKQGDIGVISIVGSLNNSDSWMNEYLGATGYPEIRDAMIHAASQQDVKAIVLDIKSGGGSVSGVSDTADLVQTIDQKVKPVYAYSDGQIASAAYWLGASARTLDIGKVTEAGSIGVVAVHQEMSKMMADNGVTVNVIRSGKYKMLGNPYEVLSDTAREVIQAQVDQMNAMFVDHVSEMRGTNSAAFEQKAGQGRVFIGQSAVDVGLVDAVSNFDTFMSKVQGGIDSGNKPAKYGANSLKGPQLKTALTETQIAALAAGAVATAAVALPTAPVAQVETPAPVVAEPVAQVETPEPVAAAPAPVNEVVAMLQAQLAAAQGQVVALSVDLQGAKTAASASVASAEKLRPIVQESLKIMRVSLGGTAAGVESLTDDALVTDHACLAGPFSAKFKVGGVAAVSSGASAEKVGVDVDPLRQARLSATRLS